MITTCTKAIAAGMAALFLFTKCQQLSATKEVAYEYSPSVTVHGIQKPNGTPEIKPAPDTLPQGMVYVPGGLMQLGSGDGLPEEKPQVWVTVKSFLMDETEVTVEAFRKFIAESGYQTDADKFGNSGVFHFDEKNWWQMTDGANWDFPQGRNKPKAADNHPVTQVSWNDASAYAAWAGKRLPSEIEWEHAARNAVNSASRYPWGDRAEENGHWKLNFFQGTFPAHNTNEDGYLFTAPVGSFGKSALGIADMSGNVWEWCADSKISYHDLAEGKFNNINDGEKAMRGGSFLCETSRCHGYRVSSRSFTSPETSLMHIGFRCVKDL